MKNILISIKPKYVANILNGEKTIEIRKTMPKCDLPIDVYIYVTQDKGKGWCMVGVNGNKSYYQPYSEEAVYSPNHNYIGNGEVVAKFTLNKVEKFGVDIDCVYDIWQEIDKTCLTEKEICDYILGKDYFQNVGYAWHISNLVIFDKPKELSEFYKGFRNQYYKREFGIDTHIDNYGVMIQPTKNGYEYTHKLTKAPQSWCYVEVEENE